MSIPTGIKRAATLVLAACFISQNTLTCYGQALIPTLTPSQALNFNPPTLKYLSVNSANPYNYFNFLLDKGQSPQVTVPVTNAILGKEAKKLIHYFFIGLTLPESSLWVNLRPDEPGRITSLELAQTDMGKLLLEQDLRLKKDVAQYLNPKQPVGKRFWEELYSQAELLLGKGKLKKTAITTSNRVWIVPDEAVVMETEDGALVTQAKLKVLLESEYLSLKSKSWNKEVEVQSQNKDQLKNLTEQLMKSIVIPEITKEVNSGKNYAPLRQIYHSLILAQWFKQKYRKQKKDGKDIPYIEAIDQSWLKGLGSEFSWSKDAIWQEYLASFQKGEYQLKEKLAGLNRMYTSGGIGFFSGQGSSPLRIIANNGNGASSPMANPKGVNDAVPVVTKIMKNPVTDGPVFWPSDIIIINERESKNNNDFVIAGDNMGGIDRSDHKEYHMQGKFAEVISEIAREIGAFQMPGGRFDLRGAVEKYPDRRIMTSYGEIYITNDEILVIVDSRFKKDHAGRGEYAVYARSRVKATHELTELKGWAEFAIKKGLTTEEEMLRGQADLGQILRSYMNGIGENLTLEQLVNRRQEIFHERDGLHQQGLEAERRLQQEQSPQHGKFAIIIYADKSTDWNGALSGLVELREELERRGYTVKNTRVDSIDSLIEKVEFYSTERAPDLLVIGAHGTRGSMHLGNGSDGYLTLQNVGKLRRIRSRLAEGGTIVLKSCSAARGEGFEDNMANAFSEIFPQAEHIFAPRVPAGPRFIFDVNNQVSGIKYGNYEGAGVVTSVNLRTFDSNLTERGYDAVAGKKIAGEIIATIDNIDMDFIISSDGYDSFLSSEDNQQGASSPVVEFTDNGLGAIGVLDGMLNGGGWQSILDAVSNNEVEMHLGRFNQGSIYIGSHIDERLLTIHEKVEIIALRYCGLYEAHRVAILFEEMFRECLLRGSDGGFQGGKALPLPEAVRPKEDGGVEKIIATIGMDGVDKEGRVMMVIKRAGGGSVSAQIVDKLKKDYYDSKNQRYDGIDFLDFIELYMEKEMEELKQDDPEYYERGTRFYNNILVSLAISSDNDTKELLIRRLKDGYFMPFIAAPGAGELIDFILLSQSTYEDQEMAIAELQDRIRMRAKERHIQYRKEQRLAIDPLAGKTFSAASPLAEQDESSSSSLVNNAMGGGNNGSANTAAEVINRLKNLKPSGEKLLQAIHGFILTAKPEYDGEKRIDLDKLSKLISAIDSDSDKDSAYFKKLKAYLQFLHDVRQKMNIDIMSYVSPNEIGTYWKIIRWLPKTLIRMIRIPIPLFLKRNDLAGALGQVGINTVDPVMIKDGLDDRELHKTIWHEFLHKLSLSSDRDGKPILSVRIWKQIAKEAGFFAAFVGEKLVKLDDMPDDDSWYKIFRNIDYGDWVFQEDGRYYSYMPWDPFFERFKDQLNDYFYDNSILYPGGKYTDKDLKIKIGVIPVTMLMEEYWKSAPFETVALAGVEYMEDSKDAVNRSHPINRVTRILADTLFAFVNADDKIERRYEFNYSNGYKVIRNINDSVGEYLHEVGYNGGHSTETFGAINKKGEGGNLNRGDTAQNRGAKPKGSASSPLEIIEEKVNEAREFFADMGMPIDETGLIGDELTDRQLDELKKWEKSTRHDGGILMPNEDTLIKKIFLAVSLWRQLNPDGSINYLLGKGVGSEIALLGEIEGRKKIRSFQSRSHSDFELYGTREGVAYPKAFQYIFGAQERYPLGHTKGLSNLKDSHILDTAEKVNFGGIAIMIPRLEILFLDKFMKSESTPRDKGTDAQLLAMAYSLDRDRVMRYLHDFVIVPEAGKLNKKYESLKKVLSPEKTRQRLARYKQNHLADGQPEEEAAKKAIDDVITRVSSLLLTGDTHHKKGSGAYKNEAGNIVEYSLEKKEQEVIRIIDSIKERELKQIEEQLPGELIDLLDKAASSQSVVSNDKSAASPLVGDEGENAGPGFVNYNGSTHVVLRQYEITVGDRKLTMLELRDQFDPRKSFSVLKSKTKPPGSEEDDEDYSDRRDAFDYFIDYLRKGKYASEEEIRFLRSLEADDDAFEELIHKLELGFILHNAHISIDAEDIDALVEKEALEEFLQRLRLNNRLAEIGSWLSKEDEVIRVSLDLPVMQNSFFVKVAKRLAAQESDKLDKLIQQWNTVAVEMDIDIKKWLDAVKDDNLRLWLWQLMWDNDIWEGERNLLWMKSFFSFGNLLIMAYAKALHDVDGLNGLSEVDEIMMRLARLIEDSAKVDQALLGQAVSERDPIRLMYLLFFGKLPSAGEVLNVYHGAPYSNLESMVFSSGGYVDASQSNDMGGRTYNFVSMDPSVSKSFVRKEEEVGVGFVLEFDLQKLIDQGLAFDFGGHTGERELITKTPIPLSALTKKSKQEVMERFISSDSARNKKLALALGYKTTKAMERDLALGQKPDFVTDRLSGKIEKKDKDIDPGAGTRPSAASPVGETPVSSYPLSGENRRENISLPEGVTMSRQLWMGRTFRTSRDDDGWQAIRNYRISEEEYLKGGFYRVYVNPDSRDLGKAVEIAKQALMRSDAPAGAAFKYLTEGSHSFTVEGSTKLVFYLQTSADAVKLVKIFQSHPSYKELTKSKALRKTLVINNLIMVSGGTRESMERLVLKKTHVKLHLREDDVRSLERTINIARAFQQAGFTLFNGMSSNEGKSLNLSDLEELLPEDASRASSPVEDRSDGVSSPVKDAKTFQTESVDYSLVKKTIEEFLESFEIESLERGSGWRRLIATPNQAKEFNGSYKSDSDGLFTVEFENNTYIFPASIWDKMEAWSKKSTDFERKGYFIAKRNNEGNIGILDFVAVGSFVMDPVLHGISDLETSQGNSDSFNLWPKEAIDAMGIDLEIQKELLGMGKKEDSLIIIPYHSHHMDSKYPESPSRRDHWNLKENGVAFVYSDKSKKGFLYGKEVGSHESVVKQEQYGGIDLSQIEVTLKDEKFVSQLNPADLKVLRAAKYLKEGWSSLSLLYVHEIMLLLKDSLAGDLKQKNLLREVLKQLRVKGFTVPEIKLALVS